MEKENNNIWNKAFAVLVVYLMLGSLISAESIAQENKDDFSKKSPLDQGDYSNPTAYPSIFSNPLFDSAFVPVERIATIPVQIVDVTRVKDKSKLTSGQLKESNNLEKVGDLSILNAAHLSTALTQKHGLPNIEITVIKGITYKNGKLINPNFPEGLDLDSIKKNPKVVAITAIDDKSKPNYNGFVVLEIDGDHKVVTSTNIGVINGFEFDENGDLIVKGTNGNFILKQGQIDGIKDEQGNSIYLAKQGAVVKYKGMEFTAQGSKGTKFNFDDKGSIAVIGAATFKGTILNHKIDGKNFQDELNIKFDETLKDFFISAKAAEVSIGEDKYSGSFSANYRNSNLMDFSLNNRGSSATIRGHLRISNDDSTPKRFVTQHSDLGKKFLPLLQESDTAKLSLETKKLWAELPNTGYIEFDANDKALAADTIPKRYVVLPGASSYGSRQDIMSFAGLKDGVYSIYVPAAHAEESGINGIEKRGKIYFQAGKLDVIGDLGIARAKTIIGLIETKIGIDTNGNIYTKLSRDSAIKNNIADAGLVIIGPPSKDAGTSMLILDEEGIHAIDKLITHASTNQNGEVLTNPEAIRRLTENFKKIGDAALELITSEKPAKDKAAELEEQVDKAKLILAQDKNNEVARRFLVAAASQYAENKQYAKAEELLKGLGQLDNDEKLALAYVLSAQDNARKRAEATEIYTKLIQDGTLTKQQSLLLAQTQLQSRDIEGVKGTLADLYAKRQLNTEQKNLYADLLQQSGNNEQARKVYSEIAADYEKKGDTRKAAQAYLKANDNSNALRFAERLEKGNLDDKAAAAHIYELNGQKDKSYTLFKETADKGVVDSQFALAQRFDATTALSPEGIQNSRRHWEAIAGNAQAAPEIREYARQKLREKDELLRVSQIVNQYKSNEDGYLRQFDQEAKKVEDIAYVPNWLDGSTSKLDALEGNWQSQSAANRRSAIRQLESALSSGLSDTSRVEVLKNLRTLYQQDKQTDKAISVINQEINRIEQKIASEPDPIKKAELQKSVSELKGANYEAHKVKVAEASQSFREASENYGLVNYALQILTSDDEKYDNTKTALEKSNKDMLQSQASYLSGLSADEIRREEQRLRQERTYKILSSAPKPEELVALQSQLESAQRQQAATLKHQQLLLSENPELRQNPQLLQTLTEARVSNQLVEEDVRENIRRSEQLKKDIEFHRNLPFTALGSGVVDKLENVPVFGGLVGMAASTVEWTASKVGLDVELTGKDQYMQSQILRLSELNRQKLEEAKENERRLIQDFRNDEILKRSTLTDSQRELLQKELINARITNAELELEYKTQKYEDLTENLREGGAGFYGRTSAGEWWNYATGKTEDAIKTYERETTRLYEDAKAGKEVLRQAEQGKSLAQIYAENPQLSQRVKGKLDNFNYDYDSTIEKTEVFERNIYDEIFNPETTLSFIVTAPAFSAVGQSTLGAISRLTQATTKGLQTLGETSVAASRVTPTLIKTIETGSNVASRSMTVASYPYRTSEIVGGLIEKTPGVGKAVAVIGETLPTFSKGFKFAAEEMWFEEVILPQAYGTAGKGVDVATGTRAVGQFAEETLPDWAEMYHGRIASAEFAKAYLARRNIDVKSINNYFSPEYGSVDVIQTSEPQKVIDTFGLQSGIDSGEIRIIENADGLILRQPGKAALAITTQDNFAESNGLIRTNAPVNYETSTGIVSIARTDSNDVMLIANSLRNTQGITNIVVDQTNGVVTAEQNKVQFALATSNSRIDTGGRINSVEIKGEVNDNIIRQNKEDIATIGHVRTVLAGTNANLRSREVVYLSGGEVWQSLSMNNLDARQAAEVLSKDNNFDVVSVSNNRVFARDLLTNAQIIIETGASIKPSAQIEIAGTRLQVLKVETPAIVQEEILISEDNEPIRKVEISGSALAFESALQQQDNVQIIKEAISDDDIIIYSQNGQKVIVVQQGITPQIVDGKRVTTIEQSIADSIKENIDVTTSETLRAVTQQKAVEDKGLVGKIVDKITGREVPQEKINEIASEIAFDIKTKEPTEVLPKLIEAGLIDEDLNPRVDNPAIKGYVASVKESIDSKDLSSQSLVKIMDDLIKTRHDPAIDYFAHGTNAKSLEGILSLGGNILPQDEVMKNGGEIVTGENAGASNTGDKISTVGGSHVSWAIEYSELASGSYAITPNSIDAKIRDQEEFIQTIISNDAIIRNGLISIDRENERLTHLKKLKEKFSKMSDSEKLDWEKLSSIPIVVLGKEQAVNIPSQDGYETQISGEILMNYLRTEIIAVPSESIPFVAEMVKKSGQEIAIIPLENLNRMSNVAWNLIHYEGLIFSAVSASIPSKDEISSLSKGNIKSPILYKFQSEDKKEISIVADIQDDWEQIREIFEDAMSSVRPIQVPPEIKSAVDRFIAFNPELGLIRKGDGFIDYQTMYEKYKSAIDNLESFEQSLALLDPYGTTKALDRETIRVLSSALSKGNLKQKEILAAINQLSEIKDIDVRIYIAQGLEAGRIKIEDIPTILYDIEQYLGRDTGASIDEFVRIHNVEAIPEFSEVSFFGDGLDSAQLKSFLVQTFETRDNVKISNQQKAKEIAQQIETNFHGILAGTYKLRIGGLEYTIKAENKPVKRSTEANALYNINAEENIITITTSTPSDVIELLRQDKNFAAGIGGGQNVEDVAETYLVGIQVGHELGSAIYAIQREMFQDRRISLSDINNYESSEAHTFGAMVAKEMFKGTKIESSTRKALQDKIKEKQSLSTLSQAVEYYLLLDLPSFARGHIEANNLLDIVISYIVDTKDVVALNLDEEWPGTPYTKRWINEIKSKISDLRNKGLTDEEIINELLTEGRIEENKLDRYVEQPQNTEKREKELRKELDKRGRLHNAIRSFFGSFYKWRVIRIAKGIKSEEGVNKAVLYASAYISNRFLIDSMTPEQMVRLHEELSRLGTRTEKIQELLEEEMVSQARPSVSQGAPMILAIWSDYSKEQYYRKHDYMQRIRKVLLQTSQLLSNKESENLQEYLLLQIEKSQSYFDFYFLQNLFGDFTYNNLLIKKIEDKNTENRVAYVNNLVVTTKGIDTLNFLERLISNTDEDILVRIAAVDKLFSHLQYQSGKEQDKEKHFKPALGVIKEGLFSDNPEVVKATLKLFGLDYTVSHERTKLFKDDFRAFFENNPEILSRLLDKDNIGNALLISDIIKTYKLDNQGAKLYDVLVTSTDIGVWQRNKLVESLVTLDNKAVAEWVLQNLDKIGSRELWGIVSRFRDQRFVDKILELEGSEQFNKNFANYVAALGSVSYTDENLRKKAEEFALRYINVKTDRNDKWNLARLIAKVSRNPDIVLNSISNLDLSLFYGDEWKTNAEIVDNIISFNDPRFDTLLIEGDGFNYYGNIDANVESNKRIFDYFASRDTGNEMAILLQILERIEGMPSYQRNNEVKDYGIKRTADKIKQNPNKRYEWESYLIGRTGAGDSNRNGVILRILSEAKSSSFIEAFSRMDIQSMSFDSFYALGLSASSADIEFIMQALIKNGADQQIGYVLEGIASRQDKFSGNDRDIENIFDLALGRLAGRQRYYYESEIEKSIKSLLANPIYEANVKNALVKGFVDGKEGEALKKLITEIKDPDFTRQLYENLKEKLGPEKFASSYQWEILGERISPIFDQVIEDYERANRGDSTNYAFNSFVDGLIRSISDPDVESKVLEIIKTEPRESAKRQLLLDRLSSIGKEGSFDFLVDNFEQIHYSHSMLKEISSRIPREHVEQKLPMIIEKASQFTDDLATVLNLAPQISFELLQDDIKNNARSDSEEMNGRRYRDYRYISALEGLSHEQYSSIVDLLLSDLQIEQDKGGRQFLLSSVTNLIKKVDKDSREKLIAVGLEELRKFNSDKDKLLEQIKKEAGEDSDLVKSIESGKIFEEYSYGSSGTRKLAQNYAHQNEPLERIHDLILAYSETGSQLSDELLGEFVKSLKFVSSDSNRIARIFYLKNKDMLRYLEKIASSDTVNEYEFKKFVGIIRTSLTENKETADAAFKTTLKLVTETELSEQRAVVLTEAIGTFASQNSVKVDENDLNKLLNLWKSPLVTDKLKASLRSALARTVFQTNVDIDDSIIENIFWKELGLPEPEVKVRETYNSIGGYARNNYLSLLVGSSQFRQFVLDKRFDDFLRSTGDEENRDRIQAAKSKILQVLTSSPHLRDAVLVQRPDGKYQVVENMLAMLNYGLEAELGLALIYREGTEGIINNKNVREQLEAKNVNIIRNIEDLIILYDKANKQRRRIIEKSLESALFGQLATPEVINFAYNYGENPQVTELAFEHGQLNNYLISKIKEALKINRRRTIEGLENRLSGTQLVQFAKGETTLENILQQRQARIAESNRYKAEIEAKINQNPEKIFGTGFYGALTTARKNGLTISLVSGASRNPLMNVIFGQNQPLTGDIDVRVLSVKLDINELQNCPQCNQQHVQRVIEYMRNNKIRTIVLPAFDVGLEEKIKRFDRVGVENLKLARVKAVINSPLGDIFKEELIQFYEDSQISDEKIKEHLSRTSDPASITFQNLEFLLTEFTTQRLPGGVDLRGDASAVTRGDTTINTIEIRFDNKGKLVIDDPEQGLLDLRDRIGRLSYGSLAVYGKRRPVNIGVNAINEIAVADYLRFVRTRWQFGFNLDRESDEILKAGMNYYAQKDESTKGALQDKITRNADKILKNLPEDLTSDEKQLLIREIGSIFERAGSLQYLSNKIREADPVFRQKNAVFQLLEPEDRVQMLKGQSFAMKNLVVHGTPKKKVQYIEVDTYTNIENIIDSGGLKPGWINAYGRGVYMSHDSETPFQYGVAGGGMIVFKKEFIGNLIQKLKENPQVDEAGQGLVSRDPNIQGDNSPHYVVGIPLLSLEHAEAVFLTGDNYARAQALFRNKLDEIKLTVINENKDLDEESLEKLIEEEQSKYQEKLLGPGRRFEDVFKNINEIDTIMPTQTNIIELIKKFVNDPKKLEEYKEYAKVLGKSDAEIENAVKAGTEEVGLNKNSNSGTKLDGNVELNQWLFDSIKSKTVALAA